MFDGYVDALHRAMNDLAIDNAPLLTLLDDATALSRPTSQRHFADQALVWTNCA